MTASESSPDSEEDPIVRVAMLEKKLATLQDELEKAQVHAAIKRSQEQFKQGQSMSLQEFDAKMRAKYNIPR